MPKLEKKQKLSTEVSQIKSVAAQSEKSAAQPDNTKRINELETKVRRLLADNSTFGHGVSRGKYRDHTIMANNEHEIALALSELREIGINAKPSRYRT